jgi:hypothetical protein
MRKERYFGWKPGKVKVFWCLLRLALPDKEVVGKFFRNYLVSVTPTGNEGARAMALSILLISHSVTLHF